MRHILAESERPVLEGLARSRSLLGFDFDGTLAPIVSLPDAAQMRETTRAALSRVAARYPVAVVSGRALPDLRGRLEGSAVQVMVGNHGVETAEGSARYLGLVQGWRRALEGRLAGIAGVEVEDKGYSLSVHYRRAPERWSELAALVAGLDGARVVSGKMVFNVVPEGAAHKGDALATLCAAEGADVALFVGDDVTDEDVFATTDPARVVSVRVGQWRASRASHYLQHQGEIDALLGVLAELRTGG